MANVWRRRKNNGQLHLVGLPLRVLLLIGAKEASGIQEGRFASSALTQEVRSAPSGSNNADKGSGHHRRTSPTLPLGKSESGATYPNTYFVFDGDTTGLDELWIARAPSPAAAAEAASAPDVADAAAVVVDSSSRAERSLRACSADDFRLSSTVYASANGCYSESGGDTDAYMNAASDRIVYPAQLTASSSENEVFAWVAGEVLNYTRDGLPVVNPACVSDEDWTVNSHPADVESWSCLIGGALVQFSEESFGAECGCSSDSSSSAVVGTPTPASSSSMIDSSPAEGSGCNADSFVLTSPHLDGLGGCFQDAGEEDGTRFFSQTSEGVGGVEAVFAAFFDEQKEDARWVAGAPAGSSSDSRIVPDCLSDNSASAAHPADSTWLCDFTGTGAYMPVSLANFQVDCGCNSTTYPGTTTPSPGSGSQDNIPSTSTPSAGNGRPTPAPTFQPFAVDRLSTSTAAPCTSVPFSAVEMVAIFTMVRFVHHLVWGC